MPFSLDNSQGNAMRESYRKEFAERSNDPTPARPSVTVVTTETINMLEKTIAEMTAIQDRVAGLPPNGSLVGNPGVKQGDPSLIDLSCRAAQLASELSGMVSRLAHSLL